MQIFFEKSQGQCGIFCIFCRFDLVSDDVDTGELSLIRIVFGPTFLLGLLFLAIMFLRVLLYIGAMYLELLKVTDSIETG